MHPDTATLQRDSTLALSQALAGDRRGLAATLGPRRTGLLCDALARYALAKARQLDSADNVQTLAGMEELSWAAAERRYNHLPRGSRSAHAAYAWRAARLFDDPRGGAGSLELGMCQDAAEAAGFGAAEEVTELMINTVASIYVAALTAPAVA